MTSSSPANEIPTAVAAPASGVPARGGGQAGPGRTIRAAREKAALTLESLAAQTRLARGTLEALERDDFGTLNEPVYVKGYYRKCAKVLGLSDTELIAAYEQVVGPRQPQAPTKLLLAGDRGLGKHGGTGSHLRWLWVVIVAALIGGAAYLLSSNPAAVGLGKAPATGDATTTAGEAPAPEAPAPTPLHPVASAAQPPAPSTTEPAASSVSSTAHAAAPAAERAAAASPPPPTVSAAPAVPPPAAAMSSTAAAAEGSLSLSFKGTSWVRIEDANGRMLLSGVIQSGDRQMVQGKPPYSVFLGNAPGVTVEFSGRPFDLAPYIKQNSTARFSVPQ